MYRIGQEEIDAVERVIRSRKLFKINEAGKETMHAEEELNAMRFVRSEVLAECRGKLRFAEKCREALLQGALSALAKMGNVHDELEKYYISAMDFEKSGAMLERVKEEIFGRCRKLDLK